MTSPCHSITLDTSCSTWTGYFTQEELHEIRCHRAPAIKTMTDDLDKYLMSYSGKVSILHAITSQMQTPPCVFHSQHTLGELQAHHDTFKFDRIQQPDHYWIHQTITKALDLYHYKYLADPDRTEADYLRRVWTFIDCCFDASKTKVTR